MSPVSGTIVLPSLVLLRRDRQTNRQTRVINALCPFIRCLRTVNRCSAFIGCGLFSETAPGECYAAGVGVRYWTAGQRVDPSRESTFVWRVTPLGETVSLMNYTNWMSGEPNNARGNEACAHLWRLPFAAWNDAPCSTELCSVCELDIAHKWSLTDSVSDVVMGLQRLQTYTYTSSLKLMQLFTA